MNLHEKFMGQESGVPGAACPWVCHLASQHLHVFPDVSGLMTPITFISQYFCNVKLRK